MLSSFSCLSAIGKGDKTVRREICSIVTRGTKTYNFMDADTSSESANAYLLAITEKVRACRLAVCILLYTGPKGARLSFQIVCQPCVRSSFTITLHRNFPLCMSGVFTDSSTIIGFMRHSWCPPFHPKGMLCPFSLLWQL